MQHLYLYTAYTHTSIIYKYRWYIYIYIFIHMCRWSDVRSVVWNFCLWYLLKTDLSACTQAAFHKWWECHDSSWAWAWPWVARSSWHEVGCFPMFLHGPNIGVPHLQAIPKSSVLWAAEQKPETISGSKWQTFFMAQWFAHIISLEYDGYGCLL